ncbi:ELECTRON TRANSFER FLAVOPROTEIN BETA SUBUNIT LYSINE METHYLTRANSFERASE [Salix koriyanagi]|uniref:ETFB lysine methyltransferase n=1 Tax=Salix koriyanagi TaxID=2511006 RepID=A0A9Q0UDT3_9ROSI|nr:ELECTRON TRANSFER FLAVOPROTEIN BETA SUBUNIT LYSINE METHYLTRANSFERASE [Salix koriyanagi]
MSRSHFFKHLSYTLVHHHRPSYLSPPLSVWKSPRRWKKPNSSPLFSKCPISCFSSSSTASPSTTSESSAYLSVLIRCPKHVADSLSEALLCFGASSASMDEDDAFDGSNEVCIDSIFPECEDVDMCLSQAANSIGLKETPPYEIHLGDQGDWVRKTQESFHPVEVTEGLWIVPEWRSPPDVQATNIILNPGLAFGTGEHPTTKLCLLLLKKLIKGEELFLDYGTGSGVLAIAALKFGAALSVGFDIDPQAITSARHNAILNSIGPEAMELHLVPDKTCSSWTGGRKDEMVKDQSCYGTEVISGTEKYDVVIANILLNPLLDLADHIVSYAKPQAVVGISGIIAEQCSRIVDRYSMLLEDISVSEMDGWTCSCRSGGILQALFLTSFHPGMWINVKLSCGVSKPEKGSQFF